MITHAPDEPASAGFFMGGTLSMALRYATVSRHKLKGLNMIDEMQASEELERTEESSESSPEANPEQDAPDEVETEQPEESQETKEETPEDQEDPDWYVKAINRQHRKYREEERRRLELEQELQRIRQQAPQQQDSNRPQIPPAPDPFDEDYEAKIQERDAAIRKAAEWDAQEQAQQHYRQQQEQQAIQARAQELRQTLTSYTDRAKEYGIKPDVLQVAGNTVATMGIHDDVATYILSDEKGPLITTYLARHPSDLEAMQSMSPVQAAVYVATKVRAKAESAHGITKAPPPPESLEGGGAPPRQRGPKGATFE